MGATVTNKGTHSHRCLSAAVSRELCISNCDCICIIIVAGVIVIVVVAAEITSSNVAIQRGTKRSPEKGGGSTDPSLALGKDPLIASLNQVNMFKY